MVAPKRKRRAPAERAATPLAWEDVLASLTDAIVLVNENGMATYGNPAAEQLLGLPQKQIRGRSCAALFGHSPSVLQLIERARRSAQAQAQAGETLVCGRRAFPARVVTSPLFNRVGRFLGVSVLVQDLSYQRAREEEAERRERLQQLAALASGLAHEFKNPLGGIKGAAQLLARRLDGDPAAREYIEVMIREVDRLSALVEQLLRLGAPPPPNLRPLNIHPLINQVVLRARQNPMAREVAVQAEFDPSLPLVRGDGDQLKQVLLNLVLNACEAMGGKGTIRLATRLETDFHLVRDQNPPSRFVRIEVADTGPGIDPAFRERIFEPFFTTKPRGTGLGLAISQRIVAEHGGMLRAANDPRGGAVMTLNLPVAAEP